MIYDLSAYQRAAAPTLTSRLIPSRFPPVGAFEKIASADDLVAVFELERWTNDRLVATRIKQLPRDQWVYGRANASVIIASFLHASPTGLRFTSSTMAAWYASTKFETALLEVANGIRKELSLTGLGRKFEIYREYLASLSGVFLDIFNLHPEFHDPNDASYPVPQEFGRQVREDMQSSDVVGLRYESTRRPGSENWVCFLPPAVLDVRQGGHWELDVPIAGKVAVRRLA